jgi:type II secretory pathway pseudopilin PulG
MTHFRSFSAGLSLIELLVVMTISLIMLGGGIAAFSDFSDRRSVTSAVEELKTYFQVAQTKANAGDLGGCTQLSGYQLQSYLNGLVTEVALQAVCSAGTASAAEIHSLSAGVIVSPNIDMVFQVLNGGVQLPADAASEEITVTNGDHAYLFTLSRDGTISEGAWQ